MNNQNQGGQADNSDAPLQSAIPNVLMTNANDENQSIRVESVILEADQHNWVANNFGKTAFVLPKKASVLSNDSLLIWRTIWSQYDRAGANKSVSFPRESGGVLLIKRCRLFVDGKLLSSNEEVGKYLTMKNKFLPYDAQQEILDVMIGSNHNYCYDTNGAIQLSEDKRMGARGTRELTNNENATYECAVPLSQLFKMLGDTLLPMSLRGEIRIEIEWEGNLEQVVCEGGGTAFNAGDKVGIEVVRPRLHLDYIQYAPEVEEALKQQITSSEGMTIAYREPVLVKKTLPAIPAGANNQAQDDLELGFMGRSVMKIYAQKLATATPQLLTRDGRSDGLTGEEVQLVVNNKTMFDRPVNKVSEMYSYLNQTGDMPFNTLPGTYGLVGVYNTADANIYDDNVKLPSNRAVPTAQDDITGVQNNYQGRQRWLGFNLASQRLGADTPSNSMKIGEAPIILRINRKNTGNSDETSNDARTRSAVNVNIWVECVNALVMKNGRVEVLEL